MVRKVFFGLVDDLTGAPAGQTVFFGLNGAIYEIDLSHENAAEFRTLLEPYITAARSVGAYQTVTGDTAVRRPGFREGYLHRV
jgi:hypothetical protein